MKAIVLRDYGPAEALNYEDVPDPRPAAGEVLVQVDAAGLNPIDWKIRSGAVKAFMPVDFPFIPGVDAAGVVREVGEGVTGFAPGDRVMAMTRNTYAELCVVKADVLVKTPEGVDTVTAATVPLVAITGDQLVRLGAKVRSGQTVLITGALGAVGRSAVLAASEIGAKVVAGVRRERVQEAGRLPGVAEAVALDDEAALDRIGPFDAVADTVGGEIAAKLIGRVKPGGAFGCVAGVPSDPPSGVEVNRVVAQADAATILRYAEAVRDGRLAIPVERTMPLAEAAQAQAAAERGGSAKIVLTT